VGQIYNLTDGEFVSKRRFIDALVAGLNTPRPLPVSPPLWLARIVARVTEGFARAPGLAHAPKLTQAGLKFLGLNLDFSIDKARRELGYQPPFNFEQGMAQTMAWYRENA